MPMKDIMRPLALILFSAALAPLWPAAGAAPDQAQQPPTDDSTAGRSCIDDLFTAPEPETALIPLSDDTGKWRVVTELSRVDGTMTYYACLPSEPATHGGQRETSASLFIACRWRSIDQAFIVVPGYRFRGHVHVVKTFDDEETEACEWDVSSNGKAIVAPDAGSDLARELVWHDTLSVRVTLHTEEQLNLRYDLRGASEPLGRLGNACRWR
jgi:hypothetical protein